MKWKRARGISCGKFDKKSSNKGGSANGGGGVNGDMNDDETYEDDDEFDDDDDEDEDDDDEFDMNGEEMRDAAVSVNNQLGESNMDKFKLEFINKQNFKISS